MIAMQTTAVYACVRILSEAIASLPIHVYRYKDGGKEMVCDYPLYTLLHDEPNPEMASFVFRETLMNHLLIWGNAYAQIIRNGKGEMLSLYPLFPNKMSVERDSKGVLYYVYSCYTDENPNMKKMGDIILRQEEVLYIPGLGFDGLIGYPPIAMARNAVGMTMACEEYGASFFANGANPSGVLEHPGVLKDPAKVRDSWNAVYRGTTNAHKIAVLEERMKYQQIGIQPEEAQFLETRKFQISEIARLFRIPPHMKDLVVNNHLLNSRADDGSSYWQNSGFEVDGENGASGNASFKCVGALNTTKTLSQEVYPATRSSYTVSASIATENLKKGANGRVGIELIIEYEDGSEETRFVELY